MSTYKTGPKFMPRDKPFDCTLYLVTDAGLLAGRDFVSGVREALEGGVTMVQLREKDLCGRGFYELAMALRGLASAYQVPLIINDRLDMALAVDADGVHLGQDDLPAKAAREILGSGKLLGISAATLGEARQAEEQGADYVGVGAIFPTTTKNNVRQVSLPELQAIKQALTIPVVAIGGITAENARQVRATGVDGLCVVRAILGAKDIRAAAAEFRQLWAAKEEVK